MHLQRCLVAVLLVLACAATAGAGVPAGAAPPPVALEQRVAARWTALIEGDFAAAYALNSPAYRELYSLEAFQRRFGRQLTWRRAEVREVNFQGDDAALVGIELHFMYHQGQTDQAVEAVTYFQESWVRVDEQWWYVIRE